MSQQRKRSQRNQRTIVSKTVGFSFLITSLIWTATFLSAALSVPKEGNNLHIQQVVFGPFNLASITREPVGMEAVITIGIGKDILAFFAVGIGLGILAGLLLRHKHVQAHPLNTP